MQFVIIDTKGKPLADVAGQLILLGSREEATRWLARGERVEAFIPKRHVIDGSAREPAND
jgi:hypothetical protein